MSAARVPRGDLAGKAAVLVYAISGIMNLFEQSEVSDPTEELAPVYALAEEIRALAYSPSKTAGPKADAWILWLGPEIPRSRWSREVAA